MDTTTSNYLDQYDAAADADKFPMVRRWIDTEPLPFFKTHTGDPTVHPSHPV